MELGSHVWHLLHLAFDFWASLYHLSWVLLPLCFWVLGLSLPFVSFGVWLLTGEVLVQSGFIGLVWVHRHLVQTAWVNMGIAHSKVPRPTWEHFGGRKKFFFWTGQSIAMIQWQEKWPKNIRSLSVKWTVIPLCPGLPPVINSLGLIKLRSLLPWRDNPCWDLLPLLSEPSWALSGLNFG